MTISVVISTRNRARSLERTLRSVRDWVDEIIVIDNESSDATKDVAKKFSAKVYRQKNNLMLNTNKNFGFTKATGDWIVCLDDDEEIPHDLAEEIRSVCISSKPETSGFWMPRKNIIFGKWIQHGIWWPDRQLRVFRRGRGKYPERHVHEYIDVTGPVETLTHAYVHYNYDSLGQYLDKMQNIYTESEVAKYVSVGYRVSPWDSLRFPVSDFLKLYFAQSGYKDGLHGLVLAGLQAFYSFIIFVKLWERDNFPQTDLVLGDTVTEMNGMKRDISYWVRSAEINESKSPVMRLWLRFIRRLRI